MKRMQRNLLRSLTLVLACASFTASLPTFAQQTEPSRDGAASERQEQRGGRANDDGQLRRDGSGFQAPAPTPEVDGTEPVDRPVPPQGDAQDWEQAMNFMKEHSPKRWALLPEMSDGLRQAIQERMFMRYRQLERWKSLDKEMHEIGMRRLAVEDELWTARWTVRYSNKPLSLEELSKVREKVAAYVDLGLEERELRIQRLRDVLRREEAFLAAEKAQRDPTVAENTGVIERGERGGFLSGGGSGGPSPGRVLPGGPSPEGNQPTTRPPQ